MPEDHRAPIAAAELPFKYPGPEEYGSQYNLQASEVHLRLQQNARNWRGCCNARVC